MFHWMKSRTTRLATTLIDMTQPCRYIFFDVANTLLHKPDLMDTIIAACADFSINIERRMLVERHKLVSELIPFPVETSRDFYHKFNTELLLALGILPHDKLLDAIFTRCSYLPWQPFDDTDFLNTIQLPVGIISNWDKSLVSKLAGFFTLSFCNITVSAEKKCSKPDPAFYQSVLDTIGCQPADIFYVGDSIKLDMIPARDLGMRTALIDRDSLYPNYQGIRLTNLNELANHIPELSPRSQTIHP